MATTTVAAAGTALALYYYSRNQVGVCGPLDETHSSAHSAPRSFLEDLYFFAEGLRYTYGETFGRWRTVDLLIGLSYLCRKEADEHPVADIARHGRVFALGATGAERIEAQIELKRLDRFLRYCSGLRERRPIFQRRYLVEILGIPEEDILMQELRAGVLKPSFVLTRDRSLQAIVLAVRGTHSFKDAFTSLTGASKPHHVIDSNGVVLGYSHFGMLAAARWLKGQVEAQLAEALAVNPGYKLYILGHSLGGGTAAMLTMMLRETGGSFAGATCTAIACPACMTLELAKSCAGYVTTVVHNTDVIPTISPGSADALRDEVGRSSWGQELRAELRASRIVRVVESGIRGVGSATATATSWTASTLSACYLRRPGRSQQLKRRNSDGDLKGLGGKSKKESGSGQTAGGEGDAGGGNAAADSATAAGGALAGHGGKRERSASAAATVGGGDAAASGRAMPTLMRVLSGNQAVLAAAAAEAAQISREEAQASQLPVSTLSASLEVAQQQPQQQHAPHAPLDMELGYSAELEVDEFEYEDDCEGVAALGLSGDGDRANRSALEAEASFRMREVADAVRAEESKEAAAERGAGGGDVLVPSVIRPGIYGGNGARGGASRDSRGGRAEELAWRRQMYPAGRIMHLVPARLVPGLQWGDATASTAPPDSGVGGGGSGGGRRREGAAEEWPEAQMEDGEDYMGGVMSSAEHDVTTPSAHPRHSRQLSELSLNDMVWAEEAAGTHMVERGGATTCPLPPLKPAIGPPPEPMVLLDGVPQEAYGRIKLCKTVLSDHVIPNYLRSLDSFSHRIW